MITIEIDKDRIEVGQRVTGRAVWTHSGGKHPRKVEVACRWRRDGHSKQKNDIDSVEQHTNESQSQATIEFDFKVPPTAPLTYSGKLFSFTWEIAATADMPWAIDETGTKVFTVMPSVVTQDEYLKWIETDGYDEDDEDEDEDAEDDVNASEPHQNKRHQ